MRSPAGSGNGDAHGGALEIEFAGEVIRLLADRAIYRPRTGELLVADVHLGKGHAFRRAGRPVPKGSSASDLKRLSLLLEITGAERLTILGDLVHHTLEPDSEITRCIESWLEDHARYEPTLIPGNHDRHAKRLIESMAITCTAKACEREGVTYLHDPPASHDGPWLAGHVHPGVRFGSGADTMRAPVFWCVGQTGIVLPAFGSFTGLYRPRLSAEDTVYAVGGESVIRIPRAAL